MPERNLEGGRNFFAKQMVVQSLKGMAGKSVGWSAIDAAAARGGITFNVGLVL